MLLRFPIVKKVLSSFVTLQELERSMIQSNRQEQSSYLDNMSISLLYSMLNSYSLKFSLYPLSEIQNQVRLFANDCLIYHTIYSEIDHIILQNDLNGLDSWGIQVTNKI